MIERILGLSIQHRALVVLLTAIVAGFGMWSLSALPIDAVPDITNNQVQINALAPALSPFEIEKQVTFPVESALAGIAGLESTRSISRNGFSQVTAIFSDSVNIYFARQQVLERIASVKENLPPGVDPKMGAITTGLGEIYMWTVELATPGQARSIEDGQPGWQTDGSYLTPEGTSLRSVAERATYLRTVQDWIIRPQLKGTPGIAGIDSIGGYVKQYHVRPDPSKLIARGLSFENVVRALLRNNASLGAGYIERNGEGYVVRTDGRIETMSEIANIVVTTRNGVPVYLSDVATVTIGQELRTGSASRNGEEVVVGTALMLIGANSRTVSAAVDAKMKEISGLLPPDIQARTVLNRTKLVEATVTTVAKNLAEGALLVILVLFLLLGNFRAALITALVIPIAMLFTAIGMLEGKISANLMSLGAIDFGLIVDGAVIIAENCLRRLAARQHQLGRALLQTERLDEVFVAAKEMIRPSVYGQAIIILVYVPLLTFSGVEGKMFAPMALTVIIALVAAFALSLTFIPAMIALCITGRIQEKENRIIAAMKRVYAPMLSALILRPSGILVGAISLFALSIGLFTMLGQEFIPTLDEKDIALHAMRIPSAGLAQSQNMQMAVEKVVSQIPEVAFVFSKTGTAEMAADPMPPNVSDTFVILKQREEWPNPATTKEQLISRMEEAVKRLPGNAFEFTQPIQMRFNELIAGVRSDIAIKIYGDEFEPMQRTAASLATIMRGIKGASDVRIEQVTGLPFLDIRINKSEVARRGLTIGDVQDVIAIAIGGKHAGLLFEGDRRFEIVIRLSDELRADMETLMALPVPLPELDRAGRALSVPLQDVATFEFSEGPNQIGRENGKRRVIVQANVRGRDVGSVVSEAQQKIASQIRFPPGYWIEWGGQFENLVAARQRLLIVVPICFVAIFLLLLGAVSSPGHALLVFSGVPLAMTGGVLALWLRGMPFSISAAVGFIALSGVAVLNGLVMLSYIKQLIRDGMPMHEAVRVGAITRLRPVAMTALVASLGFLPMAVATGTGAEVQKPLATVVIGGLISATILTLFVVPVLYRMFSERKEVEVNHSANGKRLVEAD